MYGNLFVAKRGENLYKISKETLYKTQRNCMKMQCKNSYEISNVKFVRQRKFVWNKHRKICMALELYKA